MPLIVAAFALAGRCGVEQPETTIEPVEPASGAIAAVVKAVYGSVAGKPALFLKTDASDASLASQARIILADDLDTAVLPLSQAIFDEADPFTPYDADSGDAGVAIALGRFVADADSELSVEVRFILNGAERGCDEYSLVKNGDDWVATRAQQGCGWCDGDPYAIVVARVESDECVGLWANVGTCGEWFYVLEGAGYGGTVHYFDDVTGLLIAQRVLSDVAETGDFFTCGGVECELQVDKKISCEG